MASFCTYFPYCFNEIASNSSIFLKNRHSWGKCHHNHSCTKKTASNAKQRNQPTGYVHIGQRAKYFTWSVKKESWAACPYSQHHLAGRWVDGVCSNYPFVTICTVNTRLVKKLSRRRTPAPWRFSMQGGWTTAVQDTTPFPLPRQQYRTVNDPLAEEEGGSYAFTLNHPVTWSSSAARSPEDSFQNFSWMTPKKIIQVLQKIRSQIRSLPSPAAVEHLSSFATMYFIVSVKVWFSRLLDYDGAINGMLSILINDT